MVWCLDGSEDLISASSSGPQRRFAYYEAVDTTAQGRRHTISSDEIVPGLAQGSQYGFDPSYDVVVDLTGAHRAVDEDVMAVEWPIVDGPMPDARKARALGQWVAQLVDRGLRVQVLCAAGLNRSGLIVGRALIEMGYEPTEAIARIRAKRPNALHNTAFVEWLRSERPAHERLDAS